MVTPTEVLERTVRELSLRLAQVEIDRAFTLARLSLVIENLEPWLLKAEVEGNTMPPEMRSQLQTMMVTLKA